MKENEEEKKDIIISNKNEESEYQTSIKHIQEQLNNASTPFKELIDKYNKSIIPIVTSPSYINRLTSMSNTFNTIIPNVVNKLNQNTEYIQKMINSMNFSNIINDYVKQYQAVMNGVLKALKNIPTSRLNGLDSEMLNSYYWVIPFEYDYEKVRQLSKYKTRIEFEEYMIKYFNDNRTKRLFSKLRRQFKEKDKKELLKQIEHSYFNGDYAICITSLMTLLDGATLILLQPSSSKQHISHKVIDEIKKYMNESGANEFGYELYLEVDILNNFIVRLYENVTNFKKSRDIDVLSRHINSHGVRYLNDKINALRLMNALYCCNEVIKSSGLEECFVYVEKDSSFNIVFNN